MLSSTRFYCFILWSTPPSALGDWPVWRRHFWHLHFYTIVPVTCPYLHVTGPNMQTWIFDWILEYVLYACLSLSVYLSVSLSVCLSLSLSVCLSVCLSVSVSVSVSLSLSLSLSLSFLYKYMGEISPSREVKYSSSGVPPPPSAAPLPSPKEKKNKSLFVFKRERETETERHRDRDRQRKREEEGWTKRSPKISKFNYCAHAVCFEKRAWFRSERSTYNTPWLSPLLPQLVKFSGLKVNAHACEQYIFRSCNKSNFNTVRFMKIHLHATATTTTTKKNK